MLQNNLGLNVTISPEQLSLGKYHNKAIRKQKHDRALINSVTVLFTVITFSVSNPLGQKCR